MNFEFLIARRPLSLQAKARRLRVWQAFVREQAARVWQGDPIQAGDIQLILVYLCLECEQAPDADNIVKPIQDALKGLAFDDDARVTDVECHRRPLAGKFELERLPRLVVDGIDSCKEFVYVRLSSSRSLEEYL